MQDETSRAAMPERGDTRRVVLALLLTPDDQRPWLPRELEVGDRVATGDGWISSTAKGLCTDSAFSCSRQEGQ